MTEGKSKRDICTFDYAIRVMNDQSHAGSTLTWPVGKPFTHINPRKSCLRGRGCPVPISGQSFYCICTPAPLTPHSIAQLEHNSRALAVKGAPYHIGKQGKPMNGFLLVFMASGIARGRVRTATTKTAATELRKIPAILWLVDISFPTHLNLKSNLRV